MTMTVESKLAIAANEYRGKRCWIVGSGPSLNDINLRAIPKEDFVFGLNAAITLLTHHPNAWWIYRDRRVAHEVAGELLKKVVPPWRTWKIITHQRAWLTLKDMGMWNRRAHNVLLFKEEEFIHQKTVAEDALQIARFMGFTKVNLVGIDCAVKNGKPYATALLWKECHFFNMQKPVEKAAACESMARALEALKPKLAGMEVINTSPLCAPIFPYVKFEDAVNAAKGIKA